MDENRTKELAHRSATKYWHNHAGPSGCQYGFTETHLTDFARALLSEYQKDTMFIVGVKDGNESVLGTAQITPE